MTDEQLREQIELKLHGMIVNRETTDGILRKYADELIALFEAGRSGDTIPVLPEADDDLRLSIAQELFCFDDNAIAETWAEASRDRYFRQADQILVVIRTRALLARTKETTTDA